jgi:hypothetical protein
MTTVAAPAPRPASPASPAHISTEDAATHRWAWGMLAARSLLAVGLQAGAAVIALVGGALDPWRSAADWWLVTFSIANVVTLLLLQRALAREGRRLRDLYRIRRETLRGDAAWAAGALLLAGPIAFIPNLAVGNLLWGSSQVGADLSFRAIPIAVAIALVAIFPVVQGAAELPTYFGYVMPRLAALHGWRARALVVSALMLSTQHVFLPLLFDWKFVAWRALMFLPFAFWIGWIIQRRPGTLPILLVAHGLLDASLPLVVLSVSS